MKLDIVPEGQCHNSSPSLVASERLLKLKDGQGGDGLLEFVGQVFFGHHQLVLGVPPEVDRAVLVETEYLLADQNLTDVLARPYRGLHLLGVVELHRI